jgi:hypothetical protein
MSRAVPDAYCRYLAVATDADQADAITISIAVEQGVGDDLETELQFGMDPAARCSAGSARPDEAFLAEDLFENVLTRGADIEIAGGDRAAGIELDRGAADQNGKKVALALHAVADASESSEGSFEFGAVRAHQSSLSAAVE